MGHYKSNLRDLEFNLFEVCGGRTCWARGRSPRWTARPPAASSRGGPAGHRGPVAESFAEADRNPPVFDPATQHGAAARVASRSPTGPSSTPSGTGSSCPTELGGIAAPRVLCWAVAELILGANPAVLMYACGAVLRPRSAAMGTPDAEAVRRAHDRAAVGRDDGADRAGRRLRRRRRPDQGHPAARRHLAHRGRQAVHHQRPSRTWRRTSSTWCWPGRRGRPGHQGPVACSSCPSTSSTRGPASSASATASTPPTSSTRWA